MAKLPNGIDHVFSRVDLLHLGAIREDLTNILRHLECLSPEGHKAVLEAIPAGMLDQEDLAARRDVLKILVDLGWADAKVCHLCGYHILPGEHHGRYYRRPVCLTCKVKVDEMPDCDEAAAERRQMGITD